MKSTIIENRDGESFTERIEMVMEHCYRCKVPFAMTRETYSRAKGQGDTFYCPNGHGQVKSETTEAKLRRELLATQQKLDQAWAESREQRLARETAEQQLKRSKTRALSGVCPCCNKYVRNMHRHISSKHPNELQTAGISKSPAVKKSEVTT